MARPPALLRLAVAPCRNRRRTCRAPLRRRRSAAPPAPAIQESRAMRRSICPSALGELDDAPRRRVRRRRRRLSTTCSRVCARSRRRGDGADQSAQHMKLARTYLEMGMLEEAHHLSENRRAVASAALRGGVAARAPVQGTRRSHRTRSSGSSGPQKRRLPARKRDGRCCTISGSRWRMPARRHARWRCSSNCRPMAASTATSPHRADRLARVQTGG